jgi:adenylylsulfate kinase
MAVMLKVAGYLFRKNPERIIFLDGRTFSRTYQLKRATGFAEAIGQPWRILECICSEETARDRLSNDSSHPAADRNFSLHREIRARFQPINFPKTIVDTDRPIQQCIEAARNAICG